MFSNSWDLENKSFRFIFLFQMNKIKRLTCGSSKLIQKIIQQNSTNCSEKKICIFSFGNLGKNFFAPNESNYNKFNNKNYYFQNLFYW